MGVWVIILVWTHIPYRFKKFGFIVGLFVLQFVVVQWVLCVLYKCFCSMFVQTAAWTSKHWHRNGNWLNEWYGDAPYNYICCQGACVVSHQWRAERVVFFKKLIVRKFFIVYETDWLVSLVQHFKTDEPGFRGGLIVVDQYVLYSVFTLKWEGVVKLLSSEWMLHLKKFFHSCQD